MKRSQMVVENQQQVEPGWARIIEQIKNLPIEQRLRLAKNIEASAQADVKTQQEKLQGELAHLTGLLGGQQAGAQPAFSAVGGTTVDKVLAALRNGGGKTVKDLQRECGTPWVNTALSQLLQSRQIVKDANRPAGYSIR